MATEQLQSHLEEQKGIWGTFWSRDSSKRQALIEKIEKLRQKTQANRQVFFDPDKFDRAIDSTRETAGKGIDQMATSFVKTLCREGREALRDIANSIVQHLAWPNQAVTAAIVLLTKPGGGFRPIALLHMLYRWITKSLRQHVFAFDVENAGEWDWSVPSRSAQDASYQEAIETELQILSGAYVAGSLVDLEKFYDKCDLGYVVDAAEQLGYPGELIILAIECCLGVRTITVQGQTQAVCKAATGLLPGCGQAVSLARCILFPVLAFVHKNFRQVFRSDPMWTISGFEKSGSSPKKQLEKGPGQLQHYLMGCKQQEQQCPKGKRSSWQVMPRLAKPCKDGFGWQGGSCPPVWPART